MLLAEGAVDIAAEPELELYDMAALDVIVREAGGRFTSLDGTDGPFGGNALATNGHLHEAALAFLGSLPDDDDDPDYRPRGPRLGARPARPADAADGRRLNTPVSPLSLGPPEWLAWSSTNREHRRWRMRISDVLKAKPSQEVVTISPDAAVRDLVALLAEHNVGALIVSADGETVDGIVSERDVVRRLHRRRHVLDNPVGEIMTVDVQTCEQRRPRSTT